ncbi:hypothetical protein SteCoe_1993 [Stentor coeruleus]|uniref:Uncharacterized protein n=1 Tax=Stentor coeruleus TaxID=5963 RepID=A0A1R2D0L8_9CILI|nr:hypothetical protein SteCoe_1993 [Stentor coeruleus]
MELRKKESIRIPFIKPKLYSFGFEKNPQYSQKKKAHSLSLDKNFNLANQVSPRDTFFNLNHTKELQKSFGLKVVSKARYALCEIQDLPDIKKHEKKVFSDKIKLITDYYARRKSLDKAKEKTKVSVSEDVDTSYKDHKDIQRIYYTIKDHSHNRSISVNGTMEKNRRVIRIQVPNSPIASNSAEEVSNSGH